MTSRTPNARRTAFATQGELRLGYGNQLNQDAATCYPTGSFLYVPGDAVHFDGYTDAWSALDKLSLNAEASVEFLTATAARFG